VSIKKSLHKIGILNEFFIFLIKSNLPRKKSSSVKTERAEAPLSIYILAIFNGSKLLTSKPADGLAFLISAIIEILLSLFL